MLWSLFWFLIIGFLVGFIARALVSGPSPKGCVPTTVLGVIGSFIGGFIGHALFDSGDGPIQAAGIFGSIVGSVVALLVYRRYLAGDSSR